MQGRRFSSATSCARRCFFTVIGKYVPPFTVASLATTITSQPLTRPMPVMSPAAGAASSYMPCAANGDSSRNGEPGSSRARMRSRGSSLPRATCFSRAFSPPPSAVRASWVFNSSVSLRRFAALPRKASLLLSMAVERTVMVDTVAGAGASTGHSIGCCREGRRSRIGVSRSKKKPAAQGGRFVCDRMQRKGSVTLHCVLGLGGGDLGGVCSLARLVGGVFHGVHRAGAAGSRGRGRAAGSRCGSRRSRSSLHRVRSCTRRRSRGAGSLGSGAGSLRGGAGGGRGGAGRVLLRFIGSRLIAGIVAAGRQRQGHCSGDGSHEYGTRELHWRSPGLGRGKPRKWPAY